MVWINGMSDIIPAGTTEVRLCRYEPNLGGCHRFYVVHPAVEDTVDPKLGHPWVELTWRDTSAELALKRRQDWTPDLAEAVISTIVAELRATAHSCQLIDLGPITVKESRWLITSLKRCGFRHAGTQRESGTTWRGRRWIRHPHSPRPRPAYRRME